MVKRKEEIGQTCSWPPPFAMHNFTICADLWRRRIASSTVQASNGISSMEWTRSPTWIEPHLNRILAHFIGEMANQPMGHTSRPNVRNNQWFALLLDSIISIFSFTSANNSKAIAPFGQPNNEKTARAWGQNRLK